MGRSPNNSNGPDNAAVAATSCRLRVRGLLDGVTDNICPMCEKRIDQMNANLTCPRIVNLPTRRLSVLRVCAEKAALLLTAFSLMISRGLLFAGGDHGWSSHQSIARARQPIAGAINVAGNRPHTSGDDTFDRQGTCCVS